MSGGRKPGPSATPRLVRGVSLLEMLLVVAIIAVASLLATAALSGGFDGLRLRSSAKEIAANLRYTRAQAIATGQPQRFVIDPRAHAWQGAERTQGRDPEEARHRLHRRARSAAA